jgi:hypothetical protein
VRALLGPLAVHGLLALAGFGVLRLLGVIPGLRSRAALAAAGLAYLVGIAATLSVLVIVLVLGGPFNLFVFGVVAALFAAPLLRGRALFAAAPPSADRAGPAESRWVTIAIVAALGALAVVGLLTVGNRPLTQGADAWNLWARKALLLFESPHLPSAIFSFAGDFRYEPHYNINPSYPLLIVLLEALQLRALGHADPASIHIVLWLLGIAFVWAGGFIASRVAPAIVWAPVLAAAALLSVPRLMSGYADVPLAYYLGLATLVLGIWLQSERRSDLALAIVLLGGAAGIKDEGTTGALAIVIAALVVLILTRRRRAARELVLAAVLLAALTVVPWRLWVMAHHLQTEDPLGRLVNPSYLFDNIGKVGIALRALVMQLDSVGSVMIFAGLGLAMALVAVWDPRHRALGGFYLGAALGYLATLLVSYWIWPFPLANELDHSAPRVVIGVAFIAVAAILQLAGAGATPPP